VKFGNGAVKNVSGNVRVSVTYGRIRVTIVAVEKQNVFTYSECVSVALVIQHAVHIRRIIVVSGLPGSTLLLHIIS
jgi:hypothetical protein